MKTHTTIGYKMCMKDPKLRPYAAGALYHHEALNGTGYPNGVTAKDIPFEAQIIRVADEFEAISAKRQYKTHVGIIETLNMLIDDTKPSPITKLSDGLKILSDETRKRKN
jgi:HD-GYP domain-containing protein (c-di-GMP phosphodiesterase class II)